MADAPNLEVESTCRHCGITFRYQRKAVGRRRKFCDPCVSDSRIVRAAYAKNRKKYDRDLYEQRRAAGVPWQASRKKRIVTCVVCGAGFETVQNVAHCCSAACVRQSQIARNSHLKKSPAEKRLVKQARWHRRRARKASAPIIEKVDLLSVCQRDGWTCWICGDVAPEELRGKSHPWAPTVDHIIPLARGGSHTAANLKCAHLSCNSRKHDRLPSEIGLAA